MPYEVKRYKAVLDQASGGNMGSPHYAILVDGVLHHYGFQRAAGRTDGAEAARGADRRPLARTHALPDAAPARGHPMRRIGARLNRSALDHSKRAMPMCAMPTSSYGSPTSW